MRRVAGSLAFIAIAFLGFGASLVLAGSKQGTPGPGQITLCHSGNGENFAEITVDASGSLAGHVDHDPDIIPPFTVIVQGGSTNHFPGQNMDTFYGEGYTGGEVLANGCEIPSGGVTETVQTQTVVTTETIATTVTEPGTTVTLPASTETTTGGTTISVPGDTVTVPGDSTTVTLPGGTTTLTTPGSTVTLPAATATSPGQTITEPSQTVTTPGDTTTVTASGATTVTVTTPATRYIRGGVLAARIRVAIKHHRQLVRVRRRLLRLVLRTGHQTRIIVIVVRPKGCPAGTKIFHDSCAQIVHGRG